MPYYPLYALYIALGAISGSTAFGLSWVYFKKFHVFETGVLLFFCQVLCLGGWDWWVTSILRDSHEEECLAALWSGTLLGALFAWRLFREKKRARRRR